MKAPQPLLVLSQLAGRRLAAQPLRQTQAEVTQLVPVGRVTPVEFVRCNKNPLHRKRNNAVPSTHIQNRGEKKRKTISTTDINASRTTLFSWLSFKTGNYNSLFFSSFSLSVTLKYVNVTKISTNMYSLTDDQMILTHRLDMWIKTNQ